MRDILTLDDAVLYDELNAFNMQRINLTPAREALMGLKECGLSVLVDGVNDTIKLAMAHTYVKMRTKLARMRLDGCREVPHYADLMELLYLVDLNRFTEKPRTLLYNRRMVRLGTPQEDPPLF